MQLTQDLVFALRSARQRPAFTVVLVGALALGIGLTTAIFSVFYGVLLKPLPFHNPSRLVLVREKLPKLVPIPINLPASDALEFAQSPAFSDTAMFVSTAAQSWEAEIARSESIACGHRFVCCGSWVSRPLWAEISLAAGRRARRSRRNDF